MEKELTFLGQLLENPAHPFIAVMGGAKVSDKMGVIRNILDKVDALLIGGGMAANFLKAQGYEVGASAIEEDKLDYTREMLIKRNPRVYVAIPCGCGSGGKIGSRGRRARSVPVKEIPPGWIIADIGPDTVKLFVQEIRNSKTAFWNGPMGVFEIEAFAHGTRPVCQGFSPQQSYHRGGRRFDRRIS